MSRPNRSPEGEEVLTRENAPIALPVRRGPNSVVPIDQPGEAVPPPDYEFLHVSGDGFKPVDVASRKLIRSHVMRNYFQEKNKKSSNDSSVTSAETVNSRDKLKGRWRRGAAESSAGRPPAPRRKSSNKTTTSNSSGGASRRSSQHLPLDEAAEEFGDRYDPITDRSCTTQPLPQLVTQDDLAMIPSFSIEQFQCTPVEPFNVLPIDTSRTSTNRIVHFCKLSFLPRDGTPKFGSSIRTSNSSRHDQLQL